MNARPLIVALALGVIPGLTSAQTITGVVVDTMEVPVPGVVVLLIDSTSNVVARDLSDDRGAFRVRGRRAGWYRVRTLRIGFRPVTSEATRLAFGSEVTQRIVVTGLPARLDTVRVAGRSPCEVRPDSAALTFAVWEQVRAALSATELTAGSRANTARIVSYERVLDALRRGRVRRQTYSVLSGLTVRPWKSLPADALRRGGYVVDDLTAVTYYAPDIAVLLSDAFIEDHCFRLARSDDAALIGIAFEPTRERRRIPDIAGTLWVDRGSSELKRLEFRYVNVSREQETGGAGGEVEFARMANGAWVIAHWSIRMPVVQSRTVAASGIKSRARRTEMIVDEIRIEGGDLALVTRGADTLWSRPPMVFSGRVLDSLTDEGVASAVVALRGTTVRAQADREGRFRLADMLPGEYTVDVITPSLRAVGAVHSLERSFIDTSSRATIRVPTGDQVVRTNCGASADGIVAGKVEVSGDSVPPRNVRVVAQWDDVTAVGKRAGLAEARTDARGRYRICRVAVGATIRVHAGTDSASAAPAEARVHDRVVVVDFTLQPTMKRGAVLTGAVMRDMNGQPLADVEVSLPALSRSGFTNDQGMYRITDISPGKHLVVVRRIGYAQVSDTVAFSANQTVDRRTLLARVPTLDTVAVTEGFDAEFEEHRRLGRGSFFTRADMDKMENRTMAAVLVEMTGVRIMPGRTGNFAWVTAGRADRPLAKRVPDWISESRGATPGCFSNVFLDRMPVYSGKPHEPLFDVQTLSPSQVEAIEFYTSPMHTPARYSAPRAECGVLVIHMRRYEKKK